MYIEGSTEVVSWGGSTEERRKGRTPVAESKVTIVVPDAATMEKCLTALEESDRRLATMGPGTGGYDWQIVFREDMADGSGKVHFGVVWYDTDFYRAKREIFSASDHTSMFGRLGFTADDVSVEHWVKDAAAA
ncbi:hypothetical protein GOEFS_105_00910 [Gordonia effusa NBRC 100432]|uniref:ABM domain-containing protein n=2 Tax=Gordonia effusa TaxID=263908 RepID=H0R4S9_9ACTN|nr:hypothetical protein GOEFS_105_00910 [Gordonia effusa NBRC 100432]